MPNKRWLSNKDYDFIFSRAPRLCVDLVIAGKEGVVLSRRNIEPGKGTWHLPGGRVRFGELIASAARRIAKDETGLKIKLIKLLGFMQFPREKQTGRPRHSVSLVFLAKPLSKKIRSDWQTQKIEFCKTLPAKTYYGHAKFLKENRILK